MQLSREPKPSIGVSHCCFTMAPRRKARPLQTAEEWQVPATQRLTDRAIERGHTFTGISEESWNALATRPLSRLAAAEPIAADEGTHPRTGTQAAMLWHRTGLEGQRPAKFAPQQSAVMVEGRPVQVVLAFVSTYLYRVPLHTIDM